MDGNEPKGGAFIARAAVSE